MDTNDIKRDQLAALDSALRGLRQKVHLSLLAQGACTTKALGEAMGYSILTVRPRVTELLQAGLVDLVGRDDHGDGIYQAVSLEDARKRVEERARIMTEGPEQLSMF